MTSTLCGSRRFRTSMQSPRWKCADFPGPIETVLYGFRMTDTLYFRRIRTKAIEAVWPGDDNRPWLRRLGRERGDAERRRRRHALRGDRVVPAMTVAAARFALFLDVADLAAGRYFAIAPHHASTSERRETQEPNETHRVLRSRAEQYTCRRDRRAVV